MLTAAPPPHHQLLVVLSLSFTLRSASICCCLRASTCHDITGTSGNVPPFSRNYNTCQQTSRPLLYMLSCVVPLSQLFPAMIKPREIRWLTAGFIWSSVAVTSEETSDDTSESETGGVRTRLNIT